MKLSDLPEGRLILVGRGKLTWMRSERVSNRYGAVWLMDKDENSFSTSSTPQPLWFPPNDQLGSLYARVIDARESTHTGDLFRGIFPITPETGDIFYLGTGNAQKETVENIDTFLLKPTIFRNDDWLSPEALYNCHESIVELIWHPH